MERNQVGKHQILLWALPQWPWGEAWADEEAGPTV